MIAKIERKGRWSARSTIGAKMKHTLWQMTWALLQSPLRSKQSTQACQLKRSEFILIMSREVNILVTTGFYHTKYEDQVKKFEDYKNFKKQIQNSIDRQGVGTKSILGAARIYFNLDLGFGNERLCRIKIPFISSKCPHKPFDIYEFYEAQKNKKGLSCDKCKIAISYQDLCLDSEYRFVLANFSKKTFSCSFFNYPDQKHVFHSYTEKSQQKLLDTYKNQVANILSNHFNHLHELIDRHHDIYSQKSMIAGQKLIRQLGLFSLNSKQKIIIPVRIKDCKHLECYELTYLLWLFQRDEEIINHKFRCLANGCNNEFPFNELLSRCQLDVEFGKLISLNPDYSLILSENTINKREYLDQNTEHLIEKELSNKFDRTRVLKLLGSIIKRAEFNQLCMEDFDSFMRDGCKNSEIKMLYPGRCIKCPKSSRLSIIILLQSFLQQLPKEKFLKCPLCKNGFSKDSVQSIDSIIQFDRFMAYKVFLEEQINLQDLFLQTLQSYNSMNVHEMIQIHLQGQGQRNSSYYYYQHPFCSFTSQLMSIPVFNRFCLNKQYIDATTLLIIAQQGGETIQQFQCLCGCRICPQQEFKVTNFFVDELFKYYIEQFRSEPKWPMTRISTHFDTLLASKTFKPICQIKLIQIQQNLLPEQTNLNSSRNNNNNPHYQLNNQISNHNHNPNPNPNGNQDSTPKIVTMHQMHIQAGREEALKITGLLYKP